MKKYRSIDYLILLFILLVGTLPVFSGKSVMKWDIMDIYLPWKFFITEALKNNKLPLWNPFMNFGFAQQGDPGTWYPVSWLIGFVFPKYNISAVHFEYLVHLYIAAAGMYLLGVFMKLKRPTRLILAVSYMFSGFFISNAQHLGWLVGAAWLPYIFYFLRSLQKKQDLNTSLKLAFVLFLMLSGGYPGIFISSIYVLIGYYLFFAIRNLKEKKYNEFRKFNIYLFISISAFFVFSAVVLISSFDLAGHITRGNGLSYNKAAWGILTGAFPAKALLSLVYPFAAGYNDTAYWGADFSLINSNFGIVPLVILIFTNFQRNTRKELRIYSFLGVFFLMVAMPQIFPFRKWLMMLPYMDMFRFPTLFRLYAIFFFLLASGYAIDKIISDKRLRFRFYRFLLFVVGLFVFINVVLLFVMEKWKFKKIFTEGWLHFNEIAHVPERIFFQGIVVIILLALFAFFIRKGKSLKLGFKYIVFAVSIIDILISVQLNLPATVISSFSLKEINKSFQKLPKNYPLPSLKTNMSEITDSKLVNDIPYLWKNMAIYKKTPSSDGVSPYGLNNMDKAIKNGNYAALINHPLLFLAAKINSNNVVDTNFIDNKSYQKIKIINFNNNELKVHINMDTTQYLVFLQNYYPGWQVVIDKQILPVLVVNDTFMAVKIPKGKNELAFVFNPKKVIYAAYLSITSWIIFGVFLIIRLFVPYKKKPIVYIIIDNKY